MVYKEELLTVTLEVELPNEFPREIPLGLPLVWGIEHQIDLMPGSPLPNKLAYRMNPKEAKELEAHV